MRFKLISTRANKAIFTLIFLLALSQLFFIVPCYGNDPIATIEGGGDKLCFVCVIFTRWYNARFRIR